MLLKEKLFNGYGADIGFGRDKIVPHAIAIDLPVPTAKCEGDDPVNLGGDARRLDWFKDNALDFIYSSHLLEDFSEEENLNVLKEWSRVLKVGGNLILVLPHEEEYRSHCKRSGYRSNPNHKIVSMSPSYMADKIGLVGGLDIVETSGIVNSYSFYIVARKVK